MRKPRHGQSGIAHLGLIAIVLIAMIAAMVWFAFHKKTSPAEPTNTQPSASTTKSSPPPDSPSTLASPSKVTAADGKTYFYYGAPAGQNNAEPKRIIVDLPGHGTKAEDAYAVWQPYVKDTKYALAVMNWWDGEGERKEDYYSPADVATQMKAFLKAQSYEANDIIILSGFSRGSANTYAVAANDREGGNGIFDAVISISGGYQSDFPLTNNQLNSSASASLYEGVVWVLACGGKDSNPNRDGCPAMNKTKTWLSQHGADVVGVLEDPNQGHGAFHRSSLNLPAKAFELIEANL